MFRAYSFAEKQALAQPSTSSDLTLRERYISTVFLEGAGIKLTERHCPACGGTSSTHFAEIMGVEYRWCSDCRSVYALVVPDVAQRYRTCPALNEFKRSEGFQESSRESRMGIWQDSLFWIRFRCARYLGKVAGFRIIDIDNPYNALSAMMQESGLGDHYERVSGVPESTHKSDLIFYLDNLRKDSSPLDVLAGIHELLEDNGLLFLTARLGSGFDVLALKGNNPTVFPCEHLFLPSPQGLITLLEKVGFEVLEFFTPGNLDIEYVLQNRDLVEDGGALVDQILMVQDTSTLLEFQRFLQKSGLSSYARLVARKVGKICEN
jgi:hypothetical protein